MKKKFKWTRLILYIAVYGALLIVYFPFIWMFVCSIKPYSQLFSLPPTLIPVQATMSHYIKVLSQNSFLLWMLNTTILSVGTAVLSVGLSVFGAYGLSRFKYKAKSRIELGVLLIYMFPPILLCIPLVMLFAGLRLIDTRIGLIIAYTVFSVPFSLWYLKSYFDTIPVELDEQALVDGCNRLSAFWRIILPLATPGVFAAAVYGFVRAWAEYLYALIFTNSESKKTLSLGLADWIQQSDIPWGELMAASVLTLIPTVIFFMLIQRQFVEGLSAGALKE